MIGILCANTRTGIRDQGLRQYSAKRQALRPARAVFRAETLGARPWCECCGGRPSDDVHEVRTRARGGSFLDPDNVMALCRACHHWVTTEPAQAEMRGMMAPSWAANANEESARVRKAWWFGLPMYPDWRAA